MVLFTPSRRRRGGLHRVVACATLFLFAGSVSATQPDTCAGILSADELQQLQSDIDESPVLLVGLQHAGCTNAALGALGNLGACVKEVYFTDANDKRWEYLKCKYPDEKVGDTFMHSYVWIGGQFEGNGFKLNAQTGGMSMELLRQRLDDTTGATRVQCSAYDCSSIISAAAIAELEAIVVTSSVALYGWSGCGCTRTAQQRFSEAGVCWNGAVWPTWHEPTFRFLQCRYGKQHNSFVFIGGALIPGINGFNLAVHRMTDQEFNTRLTAAQAATSCNPAPKPTPQPTMPRPTMLPTPRPSASPTPVPTPRPPTAPIPPGSPTPRPTRLPTPAPTPRPTLSPTRATTAAPDIPEDAQGGKDLPDRNVDVSLDETLGGLEASIKHEGLGGESVVGQEPEPSDTSDASMQISQKEQQGRQRSKQEKATYAVISGLGAGFMIAAVIGIGIVTLRLMRKTQTTPRAQTQSPRVAQSTVVVLDVSAAGQGEPDNNEREGSRGGGGEDPVVVEGRSAAQTAPVEPTTVQGLVPTPDTRAGPRAPLVRSVTVVTANEGGDGGYTGPLVSIVSRGNPMLREVTQATNSPSSGEAGIEL